MRTWVHYAGKIYVSFPEDIDEDVLLAYFAVAMTEYLENMERNGEDVGPMSRPVIGITEIEIDRHPGYPVTFTVTGSAAPGTTTLQLAAVLRQLETAVTSRADPE
jgi:hypothetical protein